MNSIPKARQTAALSSSLRSKLDAYGIAATATAIGIAAFASAAQAEVVYTPAHKEIGRTGVVIDFNHDGVADVEIAMRNFFADGGGLVVYSHEANRAFGTTRGEFVSMLPIGYTVGPNSAHFKVGEASSQYPQPKKFLFYCQASSGGGVCQGPWYQTGGVPGSYVGVTFLIDGQVHYGWARVKLEVSGTHFAVVTPYLTGYAYETIANKPIVTGKTSGAVESNAKESETSVGAVRPSATLGMLSAGASALPLWRVSLE